MMMDCAKIVFCIMAALCEIFAKVPPSVQIAPKFITECTTPNFDQGYCVAIQECPILLNQIATQNQKAYKFLRASRCGSFDDDSARPLVCCGNYGDYIQNQQDTEEIVPKPKPAPSQQSNPFPEECGRQKPIIANRIFGGTDASLGEFPWLARLKHQRSDGIVAYGCVGFLVAERYVVTAAHCIKSKHMEALGPLYEVQLGEHFTNMYEDCVDVYPEKICADQPQYLRAGKPIVHPRYNQSSSDYHYDIAIVPLKEKANFTDYVQPICLSSNKSEEQEMWVSGWGKTESGSKSAVKLKVSVPRVNMESCKEVYSTIGIDLLPSQFCAGGVKGKDSCSGDSGGPLMVQRGSEPFYAEGIVSFGFGCGNDGWPGVYTSVPKFYPWIRKIINRHMRRAIENRMKRRMARLNRI